MLSADNRSLPNSVVRLACEGRSHFLYAQHNGHISMFQPIEQGISQLETKCFNLMKHFVANCETPE